MPIPDFQTVMLPLLKHLSEHNNQETLKSLAEHFQLTEEELAQLFLVDCKQFLLTGSHGLRATLRQLA